MTERPDLEWARAHTGARKGMSWQATEEVLEYARSLEQQLESITKRLEEIATSPEPRYSKSPVSAFARRGLAQELLILARPDVTAEKAQ